MTAAQKKPRGGQPGNDNRTIHRINSPRGPRSDSYIDREIRAFRRRLETEVAATWGAVDLTRAALINSVCEASRIAQCFQKELRSPDLTLDQRLAVRKAILTALDARDRKLKELALLVGADVGPADPFAVLDEEQRLGGPQTHPDEKPTPDTTEPVRAFPGAAEKRTDDTAPATISEEQPE